MKLEIFRKGTFWLLKFSLFLHPISFSQDTLHEYLGVMLAVQSAFSDRTSALLTAQTLMTDLSTLHAKVEKLEVASSKIFGGDRSGLRKVEELNETIRVTEDAKSCALGEYERIKVLATSPYAN